MTSELMTQWCNRSCAWVRVHQNLKQEKLLMMMAKTSTFLFFSIFLPSLKKKLLSYERLAVIAQ